MSILWNTFMYLVWGRWTETNCWLLLSISMGTRRLEYGHRVLPINRGFVTSPSGITPYAHTRACTIVLHFCNLKFPTNCVFLGFRFCNFTFLTNCVFALLRCDGKYKKNIAFPTILRCIKSKMICLTAEPLL